MPQQPNLVIFNPDQWRSDVMGHLGNPAARTPNLDRIVRDDAVSFRNAFCQNPVCTPSRCCFMTGWYTHVTGHRTMYHMLREHEPNLLRILKDNGYYVWWAGKNDLVPGQRTDPWSLHCSKRDRQPAERKGFHHPDVFGPVRGEPGTDTYYSFYVGKLDKDDPRGLRDGLSMDEADREIYRDGDWTDLLGAIDFIERKPPEPWCLFLTLSYPHPPYAVEEPYYSAIDRGHLPPRTPAPESWSGKPALLKGIHDRQNLTSWTEDRWDELRATYYGMCMRVDDQFGRLVDALQRTSQYDNTGIFLFSDHGDFTGDYGLVEKTQNTFEDCLTNVPLIVKPPVGHAVEARVSDALVELTDVTATVYDWTGIDPDYTHFGRSLQPVLAGRRDSHRDAVFCEGGRLKGERHASEIQSPNANDPAGLYYPRVNLQQQIPEHGKAVMLRTARYKYVRRLYEQDELYDLQDDPRELHNRIADPALSSVLTDLRERMLSFFMETGDVVPHDADAR